MPEAPNIKSREIPEAPLGVGPSALAYAELDVTTNFSFLRGASHPDEMVFRAAELGYRAIGIADRNSLAGVVRAHDAVRQVREQGGIAPRLLIGARLCFEDGPDVLAYPTDRAAYGRLCRLLTLGKRRAEKGMCLLYLGDFLEVCGGMVGIGISDEATKPRSDEGKEKRTSNIEHRTSNIEVNAYSRLREAMGRRVSLGGCALYGGDDLGRLGRLLEMSRRLDIPLVATNHVHYHDPSRRRLQDVVTCIRHICTIEEAGYRLFANDQRYLKSPEQMHRLFAEYPEAIRRGLEIAEQCNFSLDELRYEYPVELVPEGMRPIEYLRGLAYAGAGERYGEGKTRLASEPAKLDDSIPEKVRELLEHELSLIEQLRFEAYFLTVHDLVRFARSRGILCQGRGSAANSAVCYCLGVTSVDPMKIDLLFERFISAARNEPPDIDVDFEHERREEVLQYIYGKYGRERAGMTGVVITYRGRSAVRDVGKALGLSLDLVDQMARKLDWWHRGTISEEMLEACGLDPKDPTIRRVVELTGQLLGFPRHLSQHVGGMVMTRGPLCEMVPIENAAMEGRTVIEWDKDDIDTVGILKVDVLALGMLTAITKALNFINQGSATEDTKDTEKGKEKVSHRCTQMDTDKTDAKEDNDSFSSSSVCSVSSVAELLRPKYELHTIPWEDPGVYDMICSADTVGVFQVESRAQMTMLPRLRPRCFYDLVIEVAIVRPGPIQGDMVHPYLRRRNGEEEVSYPSEALRNVLQKTLGVPLFQEQAMKVAMVGAGFSAGEADQLRRAMAAWRKSGAIEKFYAKIINGMLKNGYTREFAEQCFNQIKGFGEYGFPESHAASFARLVYASAWIKRYYPAAFAAALLNSQPMGFYAPAQLVRDAKEHGVEVRGVDVNFSGWDCLLEEDRHEGTEALRHEVGTREEGGSGKAVHSLDTSLPSSPLRASVPSCLRASLRLGFRLVKGLREEFGKGIEGARGRVGRFVSVVQFHRVTGLPAHAVRRLAEADAFGSLGLSRREAVWEAMELVDGEGGLFEEEIRHEGTEALRHEVGTRRKEESEAIDSLDASLPSSPLHASVPSCLRASFLPEMSLGEEVMTDYRTTTLSLKRHPVALIREHLRGLRVVTAREIADSPNGRWVKVAGLVLIRQRPGTASGIVFETLEDETGVVNLIVRPDVFERFRPAARHAGLLQADGYVERQGQVVHIMAKRLFDLSHLLNGYEIASRDFH